MYQLDSAIAKPVGSGARWIDLEIGEIPFNQLFSTYQKIYAKLTNPFYEGVRTLDLDNIRGQWGGTSLTFSEFLIQNGNKTLPVTTDNPELEIRYAKWADAFHADYNVLPIHPDHSWDSDIPNGEKTWLGLRRPDGMQADYNLFYKHCLVSVNGFFHLTDSDGLGIYVVDGYKSREISHQNQIGIYSFRDVGELKFIPIKEEMVYKQNPSQKYKDRLYVDLGEDVSNKTVLLVLGGYLHAMDGTYFRTGNSTFGIDFGNYPLLKRYYESRRYIDLSSLPLEKTDRNESAVDTENFYSDEVLLKYATLSQSFFVILDAENIFVERTQIEKTPNPGHYISHERPVFPLITGMGKISEYWYTHEDGQWSVCTHDSVDTNYIFATVDAKKQPVLDHSRITTKPAEVSRGFFLKIGREV